MLGISLRNNSRHYESDAGAEMAATYHRMISKVKLYGSSAWNFMSAFFKKSLMVTGSMLIWFHAKSHWL